MGRFEPNFVCKLSGFYCYDADHMTNMAAMPIYGNQLTDFHETWYVALGLPPIIFCSNDDPGLSLAYFMARSNFIF